MWIMTPAKFRALVWRHHRAHGRHDLPWRKTKDVYKILVSEVMLQQTQVNRVIPIYAEFTKRFPTARKLAAAPLSDVLKSWQGLGYNRRAKLLKEAAVKLVNTPLSGTRSNLVKRLEELPGVGPYTARAIAVFAYNEDVVFVETNIRTAVIHHFFSKKKNTMIYHSVSDAQIQKVLTEISPKNRAREWYSALMDYGAHLKHSGISHNARSKTYAKQSKFTGSLREARGAILRALASKRLYQGEALLNVLGTARRVQMRTALRALSAEGLIQERHGRLSLAD